MSEHLLSQGTRTTTQDTPLPGQVPNSDGAYVWEPDVWTRLQRFLILGSEGGSYYASETELTFENIGCLRECVTLDAGRVVATVVEVSQAGRAPKNEQALYALAYVISHGDTAARRAAAEALPLVARTGTHLFHFVAYAETMRGWGRTLRWAVSNWYRQNPEHLMLQTVKYRQRDGWSHRDLLRLAHPADATKFESAVFDWVTHRDNDGFELHLEGSIIDGFERAQNSETPEETANLIRDWKLPREAVKPEHLTYPEVWRALLEVDMPVMAMVRNLANMTRLGVLDDTYRYIVTSKLADKDAISRSRIHPMALLFALKTYAAGKGMRGTNTWSPIPDVTDALDAAFYLAFDNVEPTGKKHMLAIDVSASMTWATSQVAGTPLTAREASAALALITLHAEANVDVVAFSGTLEPIGLSRRQRLDDACRAIDRCRAGSTDCALPMVHAMENNTGTEAFAVYTDSETNHGGYLHPALALKQYREKSGINARLAVVGMVANRFTIADPKDSGMLDVAGMDTATPALIADFFAGRI